MKQRHKFHLPKIFIIKDIHGREWTTKRGLEIIRGICAVDTKKYFYDLNKFGRVAKNEKSNERTY